MHLTIVKKRQALRNSMRRQCLEAYFNSIRSSLNEHTNHDINTYYHHNTTQTIRHTTHPLTVANQMPSIIHQIPHIFHQLNSSLNAQIIHYLLIDPRSWLQKCRHVQNVCVWSNMMELLMKLVNHTQNYIHRQELVNFSFDLLSRQSEYILARNKSQGHQITHLIINCLMVLFKWIDLLQREQKIQSLLTLLSLTFTTNIYNNIILHSKTYYLFNQLLQAHIHLSTIQPFTMRNALHIAKTCQYIQKKMVNCQSEDEMNLIRGILMFLVNVSCCLNDGKLLKMSVIERIIQKGHQVDGQFVPLILTLHYNIVIDKQANNQSINHQINIASMFQHLQPQDCDNDMLQMIEYLSGRIPYRCQQ